MANDQRLKANDQRLKANDQRLKLWQKETLSL